MSHTKHTPGPWIVTTFPTQIGHAHQIEPIRACLYVDHRDKACKDDKTISALANARLIAASPCLLSALKELLDAEQARYGFTPRSQGKTRLYQARLSAIAAIAKATKD